MYGKLAEITGKLTKNGTLVNVEGKLKTEKWTDNNNIERYTTKIVASEMQVLANGVDNRHGQGQGQYQNNNQAPPQGQAQRPPQRNQQPPPQGQPQGQPQRPQPQGGYQQMNNGVPDNF
jgi:single-strand DNA-binding protein